MIVLRKSLSSQHKILIHVSQRKEVGTGDAGERKYTQMFSAVCAVLSTTFN
jgi:hypothetical protein